MIYIAGLLLVWATTCMAHESDWSIEGKGSVALKSSVYRFPDPDQNRKEDFNNRWRTDLEGKIRWKDHFQMVGSVRAFAYQFPLFQEGWGEMNEAYLAGKIDPIRLTFGMQIFSWGVASIFSPTDVLNPRNLIDPLDPEKRSILTGGLAYRSMRWTLESYWIGLFRPSLDPYLQSRFFPPLPREVNNPGGSPPTFSPVFKLDESFVPSTSTIRSQLALRLKTSFPNVDLSFLFFSGFQPYPSYSIQAGFPNADGTIPISILPIYPKGRFAGVTLETQAYGTIFKVDGGYWTLEDPPKPIGFLQDPYGVFVLGVERKLPGLDSHHTFRITLQYAKELRQDSDHPDPEVLPFHRSFESTLMPVINYDIEPFIRLTLAGAYNLDENDYFLSGIFSYQVADPITLFLRIDDFGGSSSLPFGRFRENDRLTAGFEWDF